MSEKQSDNALLVAAEAGDMEAFLELVDRYSHRILPFLAHMLHDNDRAQDLAQETFVRLFQRLERNPGAARGKANCGSLIFTIAANLGRDELRRRKVRKEVPVDVGEVGEMTTGQTPLEILEAKERRAEVLNSLDALPYEQKQLLVMRDVQGMSYAEISELTEAPLGTVKSRINRARIAFKNIFMRRHSSSTRSHKK